MSSFLRLIGIRLLVALLATFTLVSTARAQNAPTQLTITVTDPSGARVQSATITLNRGIQERTVTTGPDGTVELRDLQLGEWTLTVKKDGFAPKQRPVVVQGAAASVAVALEIAEVQQRFQVEGKQEPATALRLDSAATGGTYLDIPVRDLPYTLTVVVQEVLQQRGITTATEAAELAPGISTWVDSGSIPGIDARGFSTTDAGISIMRDGVRQNTVPQAGRPLDAFLLDRVEVLKGPAALLYGEGAAGTSINYVTKEPKQVFAIDSLLSYGSFGTTRSGVGVNLPIKSNLSARLDMSYQNGGGYVDRTRQRMRSFNASVLWRPLENVMLKGSAVYTGDSVSSYYGTPLLNTAVDPNVDYVVLGPTSYLDPRTRYTNYNMRDNLNKANNNYAHINSEIGLPGGWTLRNDSYASTQRVDWRNFEGTSYNVTAQRVTLSSYFLAKRDDVLVGDQLDARKTLKVAGRSVDLVIGARIEDNNQHRWSTPSGAPTFSLDLLSPDPVFDPGLQYVKNRDVFTNTKNVFVEGLVHLTSKLAFSGGLRKDRIENHRFDTATAADTFKTYRPLTGRAGLVYTVVHNVNLYIGNSRAVQPTTPLVSLAGNQTQFSLQPSRAWEGGVKATVLRNRVDATLAYFSIGKSNILTRSIVDGVNLQQQIGKQVSRGWEFSFDARPIRNFTLSGDLTST